MYRSLARLFLIGFDKISDRNVYACRRYLEESQWMKKDELRRLQTKRLRGLLRHAYDNVPHYHESFRSVGFHSEDLRDLEDIHKIPALNKSAWKGRTDKFLARNFSKNRLIRRKTGGTSAVPAGFFRNREDVSWGIGAELRGYGWVGYEVGDKMAMVGVFNPELTRTIKFKVKNLVNRSGAILNQNSLSEKSIRVFVDQMRLFRPEAVYGNSGPLNILATFLLKNGVRHFRPRLVLATGETLLPHYRKNIEEAFQCDAYDVYGTSEVSHIAQQCREHEALHVHDENILVEVVKDGEWAAPGEQGQVLLTNLHGYGMPFIRYDVGDLGMLLDDECACGRELSLFIPQGRNYEYFVNDDQSFTFLRDLETVFEGIPVQDFQVVQESSKGILLRIVPKPGYSDSNTEFLVKNLRMKGSAEIRVELVKEIPRERSGKTRHIVSKIPTAYT